MERLKPLAGFIHALIKYNGFQLTLPRLPADALRIVMVILCETSLLSGALIEKAFESVAVITK
jgi:hypothetical protein